MVVAMVAMSKGSGSATTSYKPWVDEMPGWLRDNRSFVVLKCNNFVAATFSLTASDTNEQSHSSIGPNTNLNVVANLEKISNAILIDRMVNEEKVSSIAKFDIVYPVDNNA